MLPPEEQGAPETVLSQRLTPSERTVVLLDHSISRQALHAWELSFQHPVTRERMTFQAPLPPDMTRLIAEAKQHELDQ
ncbi:hypothetical protein [Paenibacillus sp. AR247]|uniref:hypothetical protein n=1 Tax=Paenibacillus sp. AR247 TaxID=1631599 RepID=UPI000CF84C52|nr:hypothetical protein [Paenibacillus sp. AR247]PQP91427.1 hypothetical protein CPT76_02685 [Paenibacillus sp. AR247]